MNSIHDICKKYKIKNYTINDDGSIDVNSNVNLWCKDLTEIPLTFNKVTGWFDCSDNKLTTLKGCPRWVGSGFICYNNRLTCLEFSPEYVGGYFNCLSNDLNNNYWDTEIRGNFYTTLEQDGLKIDNYNEWKKIYKRRQILDELYTRHM